MLIAAEGGYFSLNYVKTYVAEINTTFPNCILSSPNGYMFNIHADMTIPTSIPQTFQERSSYIIQKFFTQHIQDIDIYELCDELFISYASMKLLLTKMNKEYASSKLTFRCLNNYVYIDGDERDKRKFLSSIIYQESSGRFVDHLVLKEIFPSIDIEAIHDILHEAFKSFAYYINDFGYMNLSLHVTIILDRVLNGNEIGKQNIHQAKDIDDVSNVIIEKLEKHFHISFHEYECHELNDLIQSNLCLCQANNTQELQDIVGEKIYNITLSIIDTTNRQYNLNLNTDTLLYPLALHFKNLFARCAQDTSLKNPLLENMQSTCPMLFDCAIFISNILENTYQIHITLDEIAYIAMHIGSDIERQKKEDKKLKCVLLCPNYQNNRGEIYNFLLIHFDSMISIVTTCAYEHDIPSIGFDIIFSTVALTNEYPHVISIPPLKQAMDLKTIFNQIQDVFDCKKLSILSDNFQHFFNPSLFYYHTDPKKDKENVIYELFLTLRNANIVEQDFYEDVLKREEAASTAFGHIAIPHSMKMDAKHTSIALALSKEGLPWGNHLVHTVLLIAINESESYLFKELYEALILLFSQEQVILDCMHCHSFQDFQQLIYRYTKTH